MIPIVINNFNRLSTTRNLTHQLMGLGYWDIHILDNASFYPPLMRWYDMMETYTRTSVYRLNKNFGARALYDSGYMDRFASPWVVYTDSDISLNPNTPEGFIEKMIGIAEKYNIHKVGLALQIGDLPENDYAQHYKRWEEQFWQKEVEPNVYEADVDTTFCIVKPTRPFEYRAYRMAGDFTARHEPWYTDFDNLEEEEKYYLDSANDDSTYKKWYKANKDGK